MLPLSRLVPKSRQPQGNRGDDVVTSWERSTTGVLTVLTAPEGLDAGQIVITPRRRPVREPAALLAELSGVDLGPLVGTLTFEGEYAALGTARAGDTAFWLGAVIGEDYLYCIEGRAAAPWAVRLGVVTGALVRCSTLGVGEGRPRPFLHDPGEGWTPSVIPGGPTVWRSEEGGAVITAHPATPLIDDDDERSLHRWLNGDPVGRVHGGVHITTGAGLAGSLHVNEGEHVAIVRDARHRYCLTLSGNDLDRARSAFVTAIESIEPLPSRGGVSAVQGAQSHWAE